MKKTNMNYLSKKYRFFLFDQWGVLHNGNKIFKYTNKSLKRIKDKKLILISNTSQTLVEFKTQTLKKINLKFSYFDKIITAGETLLKITRNSKKNIISRIILRKKAFIISNEMEQDLVNKLKVENFDYTKCKFILSLSLKPRKNHKNLLKKIKYLSKKKIPMICTNPDLYNIKNNKRYYQIGYIAKKYSDFGGKVHFIGKPNLNIFKNIIKNKDKKFAVIIGDNLNTDVLGGKNYGISTALVFDGFKKLNKIKSKTLVNKVISNNKIKPNYLIKNISIS